MIKFINSFLAGLMFLLIIDFIFFSAVISTYFMPLEITEMFNSVFVESQNLYILLILSLPFGYLFLNSKIFQYFYLILILCSSLLFTNDIGYFAGEVIFTKEARLLDKDSKRSITLLYVGREFAYFRDIDSKVTKKVKKELVEY